MNLDEAIEAAAEALSNNSEAWTSEAIARIAVEAAAPYLDEGCMNAQARDKWKQRAERAEAEVEARCESEKRLYAEVQRLNRDIQMSEGDWKARAERAEAVARRNDEEAELTAEALAKADALADRLGEALSLKYHLSPIDEDALAAWEKARREDQ